MNKLIIAVGVVLLLVFVMLGILGQITTIKNTDNTLRKRFVAQGQVVETTLDKMRKTLINRFKVTREFADTFIKVEATRAQGRTGGNLFKMVTEASGNVPQGFNPELASSMANAISGEIAEFKRAQDTWIDVHRQHDEFYDKTFLGFFAYRQIIGRERLDPPKVISSSLTKEAMATGVMEDNILPE